MRVVFSLVAIFLTTVVLRQDSVRYTITLQAREYTAPVPAVLDTVFLSSDRRQPIRYYLQVARKDSVFILPDVPVGSYQLRFSLKEGCIYPLKVAVCGGCANRFDSYVYARPQGANCDAFTLVEVHAGYSGGDKALARTFQRALTKKEKKQLKASDDFTARFFVTKEGAVRAISVAPAHVGPEVKHLVEKGLRAAKDWMPTVRNGVVVDDAYVVEKRALLGQ